MPCPPPCTRERHSFMFTLIRSLLPVASVDARRRPGSRRRRGTGRPRQSHRHQTQCHDDQRSGRGHPPDRKRVEEGARPRRTPSSPTSCWPRRSFNGPKRRSSRSSPASSSADDFRQKRQFALSDLEKAVKLDPKQPEAYLLIAQLNLLPGGEIKRAREAIDQALALGFDEPAARAKALLLRAVVAGSSPKRKWPISTRPCGWRRTTRPRSAPAGCCWPT